MTNKFLVTTVSENTCIKRDVVRAVIEESSRVILRSLLAGNTVSIPNVGTFSLRAGLTAISEETSESLYDDYDWTDD